MEEANCLEIRSNPVLVKGEVYTQFPDDLYIPPEALEVFLETFSGPLDLLLYLIRKNNLDILDIPVFEITKQYMVYVELMKEFKLELAADYLVMAATLAEIKSKMLLPKPVILGEEEALDPRVELIRRLQEYERFKQAAERLSQLPQVGRDIFVIESQPLERPPRKVSIPSVSVEELVAAFFQVLKQSAFLATHKIQQEPLSVRGRMSHILSLVNRHEQILFIDCFDIMEGRLGIVVSFIAILELMKEGLLDIVQAEAFSPIYLKKIKVEND